LATVTEKFNSSIYNQKPVVPESTTHYAFPLNYDNHRYINIEIKENTFETTDN